MAGVTQWPHGVHAVHVQKLPEFTGAGLHEPMIERDEHPGQLQRLPRRLELMGQGHDAHPVLAALVIAAPVVAVAGQDPAGC